ncbi:MAG TPA: prephenate dehydratase domain-containing protein [Candidatus Limnocylindrales bacterium]|nr:prephenate dehydratase domain-containing protein [Candidatus Limnocylindrales bacterium]
MSDPVHVVVAFAGEPGSFAEDAVLAAYPDAEARAVPLFEDVGRAVVSGEVAAGVLPIENVVGGGVREVYDLLLDGEAVVIGEVIVPVRLCLAALPGQEIEAIERVYSHIQALTQAEPFLRSHPWTLLAATNTAGSGRLIKERQEWGSAAVLSPRAAALFELAILADDIQVERSNRTRFLVLAMPMGPNLPPPATAAPDGSRRSALVFSVRNEPGTLVRALSVIADHGINMTKLESRPSRAGTWEYVFWVDLDSDVCPEGVAGRAFLDDLRAVCIWVRVMGCYPRAAEPAI